MFFILLVFYLFRDYITISPNKNKPVQKKRKDSDKDVGYVDYEEVE